MHTETIPRHLDGCDGTEQWGPCAGCLWLQEAAVIGRRYNAGSRCSEACHAACAKAGGTAELQEPLAVEKYTIELDECELASVLAALDVMAEAYDGGLTEASVNLYSAMRKMERAYRDC